MKYSPQQYDTFLGNVSLRVFNTGSHHSFNQFEIDWDDYYNNIYKPNSIQTAPPRIFIAESAPSGHYHINSNYIFLQNTLNNNVHHKRDMYLYRYYRGVFPNTTPRLVQTLTKRQALIDLSNQNILILDLLPTHGIKLEANERVKIKNNLLNLLNFGFFNGLNYPNRNIHYAFSVPPSLYTQNIIAQYLNPNQGFLEFGNVNSGQGHAPSIATIQQIIQNGF